MCCVGHASHPFLLLLDELLVLLSLLLEGIRVIRAPDHAVSLVQGAVSVLRTGLCARTEPVKHLGAALLTGTLRVLVTGLCSTEEPSEISGRCADGIHAETP